LSVGMASLVFAGEGGFVVRLLCSGLEVTLL